MKIVFSHMDSRTILIDQQSFGAEPVARNCKIVGEIDGRILAADVHRYVHDSFLALDAQ